MIIIKNLPTAKQLKMADKKVVGFDSEWNRGEKGKPVLSLRIISWSSYGLRIEFKSLTWSPKPQVENLFEIVLGW